MTLLLIVFAIVMVHYGIARCMDQVYTNRLTAALRIPEWYYSSFVPIGGGLLVLHSLERIVDCMFEMVDRNQEEGSEN